MVTSISVASAAPCAGSAMPGRALRMCQPQPSMAMAPAAMPARRTSIGTTT